MKTFLIIFIPLLIIALVIISLNHKKKKPNFNGATLREIKQKIKVAIIFLEEKDSLRHFYEEVNASIEGNKITTKKELYDYMLQKILNGEVEYKGHFFDPFTPFSNNVKLSWEFIGSEYAAFYGSYISDKKKPFGWTNPQETKKQLEDARWDEYSKRIIMSQEC